MLPCLGAPSRPKDSDTPAGGDTATGAPEPEAAFWAGSEGSEPGLGAASFALSVRGSRAAVRRGSGLRRATSSGAPSPGLLGPSETGPAALTPGDTHRPISRRSLGSSRSSRSHRNCGRRHPRPRSRPTPSAPPAGRPEMASARPAPGAGRSRHAWD